LTYFIWKGGTIRCLSRLWLQPSNHALKQARIVNALRRETSTACSFCANDLTVFESQEQEQKLKFYV